MRDEFGVSVFHAALLVHLIHVGGRVLQNLFPEILLRQITVNVSLRGENDTVSVDRHE
jgi:hypothetical protein